VLARGMYRIRKISEGEAETGEARTNSCFFWLVLEEFVKNYMVCVNSGLAGWPWHTRF